jgi:VanZ family protein
MHKTSAWPLALVYGGVIVYASLYPFSEWRDQGILPWAFLGAAMPAYWTGFDITANVLGYVPLGFLLALSALRRGHGHRGVWLSFLGAGTLSLMMESLQSYLPSRVPSTLDFLLNTLGVGLGVSVAVGLERLGALDRWSRFRARWFVRESRGAMVLLALWPAALLFPAAVPLGLGQVLERLETALAERLVDTPFLDWLPVRDIELQPLVPGAELLCVMLGAMAPALLAFCVIRAPRRRALLLVLVLVSGLLASALSATLSFGPQHAWAWFSPPVKGGLVLAFVLTAGALWMPPKTSAALLLLALALQLSLLNQAPTSAYFAQTLSTWEQGRFIRFHGLAQWLGWLWPYATLLYALAFIGARETEN